MNSNSKLKLGLLHSTIREDEKLIFQAAKKKGIDLEFLDARNEIYNPQTWHKKHDLILERCLFSTFGFQAVLFFENLGIKVINPSTIAQNCDNKFLTSLLLKKNKVPTVPFALVLMEKEAKIAVSELGGYPVVVKPVSGSWGRLLAKVNDEDALEAIIEQKQMLGSPMQKLIYLQKFVSKPGRDIRVAVLGDRLLCAIYRETDHWITNTARGAVAKKCAIDKNLSEICQKASKAVGGGILGIDIFETDRGLQINEINHTMEFKNVQR